MFVIDIDKFVSYLLKKNANIILINKNTISFHNFFLNVMWTTAHQHFVKKNCKIVCVSNITFISNMAKEATN